MLTPLEVQKMNKKILVPVAILTTGAMLLTGCGGGNNAQEASRKAIEAARKTDYAIKRLDTYTDAHFNFPQSLVGNGYRMVGDIAQGCVDAVCVTHHGHNQFHHRMNNMHHVANNISQTNTSKYSLIQEVRHEAQTARNLSNQLKRKRVKNADFTEFKQAHKSLNTNLRALNKQRGKIHRDVRMVPKNNRNINVDALTNRYGSIQGKLDTRKATLTNIRTDLQTMNRSMSQALSTPRKVQTKQTESHTPRRIVRPRNQQFRQQQREGFVYPEHRTHQHMNPTTHKQPQVQPQVQPRIQQHNDFFHQQHIHRINQQTHRPTPQVERAAHERNIIHETHLPQHMQRQPHPTNRFHQMRSAN